MMSHDARYKGNYYHYRHQPENIIPTRFTANIHVCSFSSYKFIKNTEKRGLAMKTLVKEKQKKNK